MCVNSLNTKTVCKNAAGNLVVLDFCINTHTHTHNFPYNITETTAGNNAVVQLRELQSPCSPPLCCACILPIATFCLT